MESRRGLIFGIGAYGLWGAFPLYFPLLEPGGAIEILAHRIVWSALVMALLVLALRRRATMRDLLRDRRKTLLLVLAAATITFNWGTYIYGVNSERVVETSLGYFINPLVTVLMGVIILGERLRWVQWTALGIGFVAVAVLTWDYGRPPWIALVLAFSFGTYGLAKKTAGVGAIESLALETALIAPFALCFLAWLGTTGDAHFGSEGIGHVLLLMSSGVVTAIPLLLFSGAATRLTMTSLGLLQYLAPILQFALGVTVLGEHMPPGRWIGFALVWLALSVFTWDALRERRRQFALVVETAPAC
ncbi:EamA family transporter RarD [Nocardioides bizhenqiangii]|uniref:EamA family transporter RarD n=1 Tax=Nocardioides bizhenqiangii TaxID=3095076 RepID=A0ABZ0ZWJ5_9ACTN|nr:MULTISPECIES: EamA family transporter RarD [unclassified Nocardioides]MDZ5622748.1 EamA family transporter RarD [Nocardioides sp. HM23]WQQ28732.1 EamA family transporter RarD [Nocardioides sp. HM61]